MNLKELGHEAVFVGGAVRDYVLNKDAHDIDIATSALPEEVKSAFTRTADIGLAHGTVLVIMDGSPIEVTTFRTDGEYVDHRRPAEVTFVRSLEEDLKRRDFTMNALAMNENHEIIDLFNGREDLRKKVIRTVGNPISRFKEDALRMLRGVRFSAQLGFEIEPETFRAIKLCSQDLAFVSVERVTAELEKIWTSNNLAFGLRYLKDSGLAHQIPGGFPFTSEKWMELGSPQNALVCWAYLCLLQEEPSPVDLANVFKLSNSKKNQIQQLVNATLAREKRLFTIEDLYRFEENALIEAEKLSRILWSGNEKMDTQLLVEQKKSLTIQSARDLKVSGRDLMSWFRRPGGPWLKATLTRIELAVLHQEIENDAAKIKEWILHEPNSEI